LKTTVFCVTLISLLLLSLTNHIFIFDFSEPIFIRVYGDDEGEDGGHQGEDGDHQGDHQGKDVATMITLENFLILGFLTVTIMTIIISPTRREMTIS
jgi:hypothetical protein